MRIALRTLVPLLLVSLSATAATPPDRMNYQGVLRDSAGNPLDGSFDVTFRFFDADTLGNEILVDGHLAANGQAVQVTGGMFSVALGGGQVLDGTGPGTYTGLVETFADYTDVWLEIEVGAETLTPRLALLPSGTSLNTARLDGKASTEFIDTSATEQLKEGRLILGVDAGTDSPMLQVGAEYIGGYFWSPSHTGTVTLAGHDYGIIATGTLRGGSFSDTDSSGGVLVAAGDQGVYAYGNEFGGYFEDSNNTGYGYVGYGNSGVQGYGSTFGAYFADLDNSAYAYVGDQNNGISAYGLGAGGYFEDLNSTGYAIAANGDWGLYALGNSGGVTGVDGNSGIVGYLATGTSSTQGNGSKNFVQNHPYRKDQVILYAAPEGNEVATYTRGTARLVDGEARIALDETFAWVTNPDIGLTVHLTPVGEAAGLYVVEKSTSEIVVRGTGDAAFDYMVWGLRIGFEAVGVVEDKGGREAPIPSMAEHVETFAKHPELRKHNALERFKTMNVALGKSAEVDLSASKALRDAIGVFDPAVDRLGVRPAEPERVDVEARTMESPVDETTVSDDAVATARAAAPERPAAVRRDTTVERLAVAEPVAAGELIVMDELGELVRGLGEADPGVVGVAAADSVSIGGEPYVELVSSGIATLRVDADLGAIARGDLLVSSPTPGHAMRAWGDAPGTVVAKALEPLESGRGLIRVVITLR